MLIGSDMLDEEAIHANNDINKLICPKFNWSMPIQRKISHLYVSWKYKEILYTKEELIKMHIHFYHLSSDQLWP